MLSVWWNIDGIVHYELVPDGRTVNADLYSEQPSRVYGVLKTRYPALINQKRVLLQHDNAPAHRARLTTNRIKDLEGIEVLPHPAYRPDIAISDYTLFRFKSGRISIEDDPRQGRPKFQRTDENVQKITDFIKENPRTTLLELEKDTDIFKTTIGRIVTEELKLKKTPEKFIPRFLTNEQKLCRLATCEDMLEMTRTDPEWKDKIITDDETWVYGYDPETKRQSAEWRGQGEPRPKKSRNKVLLVDFFYNKGIVHHEYLSAGQTVIKEMYLSILRRLRKAIRKKNGQKNGLMVTGSYTMTMPALTQRTW
ncbi:hypothetical protein LAZ67_8000251 [Cordylochernes scorpioides]|uniref:Transposase n=1 Tax=Cordylochernes scorpioides TaxID=51811 RepID=A0ABY6KR70_9ARAC|nr:hypothetical protein LAZ67_8000251 [Cordylochernes scorpioides]